MKRDKKLENNPFEDLLDNIQDPRKGNLIHYPLQEILFLLIIGTLSGCEELTMIEVFGKEKIDWLRMYYDYKKGIPSHDTLSRVLGLIDKKAFEKVFCKWVINHFKLDDEDLVNIDGKRLSNSADRMAQCKKKSQGGKYAEVIVNVYAAGAGIVLAQKNVSEKMDELAGAIELMDWLELEGACVTADSIYCRRSLIERILEKKADYILALKGNSPNLHNAVKNAFEEYKDKIQSYQTEDQAHGRKEKRVYDIISADLLPKEHTERYPQIKQVVRVQRNRTIIRKQKESMDTHYYITSSLGTVEELAIKIRKHWSIENQLHHVLDVSFKEDDSRVRYKNAATNFSLIRKATLNALRNNAKKGGIKHKRLKCAISDKYRSDILKNTLMR